MPTDENKTNKYNNSKIYTIRCRDDNNLIYVGSTTRLLYKRWYEHKRRYNNENCDAYNKLLYVKMRELGVGSFYIELYENINCDCMEQLNKREGQIIREIGTLNKNIAGRTFKEYYIDNLEQKKQYYIKNKEQYNNDPEMKEKMKQYKKEYNNDSEIKEKKKQFMKQYNNKPEVKAKRKEYNNSPEIKEKRKEYYNSPEIKEKRKEYYKQYNKNKPEIKTNYDH